jgi:hypothetical protein
VGAERGRPLRRGGSHVARGRCTGPSCATTCAVPGSGPVAFGSFTFDDEGTSVLVVPEVVVGRRDGVSWVTTISQGDRVPPSTVPVPLPAPNGPGEVTFNAGALSDEAWARAVSRAVARIAAGDLDKVVLARDVVAETERALDTRWPLVAAGRAVPGLLDLPGGRAARGHAGDARALDRGWPHRGCSPARSDAAATTSTTWRWPPHWPGRPRITRSTSSRCARWPTRCPGTARSTCRRRRSCCTCRT